jgi:hypothetical protein
MRWTRTTPTPTQLITPTTQHIHTILPLSILQVNSNLFIRWQTKMVHHSYSSSLYYCQNANPGILIPIPFLQHRKSMKL